MTKSTIVALLAATAMIPAIADAQQANVEVRGDAQTEEQRQAAHAQRDQYRAQHQQDQRPQAPAQGQPYQGRPDQGRPDQGRPGQPAQYQQGQYRQGQYQQGQYQQGQYQGRDQQGRYQGQRPEVSTNGRGGYAPGGQGGYGVRGNEGRGYDDRGPQNGRWNNGWHGDDRYDWNRYRAQNRGAFHLPRYYAPPNFNHGYRRFSIGITLGRGFYGQNYWIGNPYDYRLPPAYGPYRWVRYYNDALLVDVRSGYVVDAVYGIFW